VEHIEKSKADTLYFQYYQDRLSSNETSFEKIVRCLENGTPLILKDVDSKMIKMVQALIQWRFRNFHSKLKDAYYSGQAQESSDDEGGSDQKSSSTSSVDAESISRISS